MWEWCKSDKKSEDSTREWRMWVSPLPRRIITFFLRFAPLPRKIARMSLGVKGLKALKSLKVPFGFPPLEPPPKLNPLNL